MRIKDEIFCFAHLQWCHNGWASNILTVVDAHPLWHHQRWAKQRNLIFYSQNAFSALVCKPRMWCRNGQVLIFAIVMKRWTIKHSWHSTGISLTSGMDLLLIKYILVLISAIYWSRNEAQNYWTIVTFRWWVSEYLSWRMDLLCNMN